MTSARAGAPAHAEATSFSWRLLVAPADVLEYVVVHELCHVREPNHSKAFWRLLDTALSGWQEQARWLREHGQELHDYRPSALPGVRCQAQVLEHAADGHSIPDAHRRESVALSASFELGKERRDQACAGRPEGMAE